MLWMVPRFLFADRPSRRQLTGGWSAPLSRAVAWPWTAAALGRARTRASSPRCSPWLAGPCWPRWFGRTQFERNLRFDAVAAQATPLPSGAIAGYSRRPKRSTAFPRCWLRDPAGRHRRKGTALARAHAALPHGLRHGLLLRPDGVAADDSRQPSRAATRALSHHFLTVVCVYALTLLGQVSYLELLRLRPLGGADLLRRAAAAGQDLRRQEPGGAGLHLPGGRSSWPA